MNTETKLNLCIKNNPILQNPQTTIKSNYYKFVGGVRYFIIYYISPFGSNYSIHREDNSKVSDYFEFHKVVTNDS